MNLTSRLTDSPDEDASARAFLGDDHPLVRVSDWLCALRKQSLAVAALGMLSLVALVEGEPAALVALAADAAVGATLAVAVCALAWRARWHALTLIDQGQECLPIAAVRRERQRLLDPRHREELAAWLETVCDEARHPAAMPAFPHPLFRPRVIAAVQPQLAATATALRADNPGVRGVLGTQRLLEQGASPLYGHDADLLRRELQRIQLLLTG